MDREPVDGIGLNSIALVGSYVPRRCGIATFTKDLRDALSALLGSDRTLVLALEEEASNFHYPPDVRYQIRAHQQADYRIAADLLNINQVDVAIVQHEFGIYGGADGSMLLTLLRRLRMPVITTLHTVLKEPSKGQARVMRELTELSDRLVVMSHIGAQFLRDVYSVPEHKIVFIPHGIPDVPFVDPSFYKDQFGLEGRTSLLTFGLLSPSKGIEVVLNALPKVVQQRPDVMYVILGATHPNVLREQGDAYRNTLSRLVDQNGLRDHVMFQNRFVSLGELCRYIGAADLYLTPYLSEAQITSGTLAYTMGAGKAVLSTPYWYAQEMLAEGRGRLFAFNNVEELQYHILDLLDNPVERNAMRKSAYVHCRPMVWREVAHRYLESAQHATEERRQMPRRVVLPPAEVVVADSVPDINLNHLCTMTDDTGIFQHAIYTIPDRNFGYCTDDNARALVAALRYYDLRKDEAVIPLAVKYLAFIHGAFNREIGRFRNFMSYDRKWLEESGSEDCHARAIWALGEAVSLAPNLGVLGYATRLLNDALSALETCMGPRASAFALVGIHAYLRRFGGDTHIRRVREVLAHRLYGLFAERATPEWPWCEDSVTYCNARLPHALILCGQWLPDQDMLQHGLRSLDWLLRIQTNDKGDISLIGCNGWYTRGGERALFDQQPIEIMSLVDACAEAYRATKDPRWGDEIRRCLTWFLGKNDVGVALYDFKTGGCRDGLNPQGANQNEGAESTLSWVLSLLSVYALLEGHETDEERQVTPA